MRDLISLISPVVMLGPAVLAADNAPVAIDLQNFDSAAVSLAIGVGGITFDGANKIDFVLKHGDTTNVANHTPVAAGDVYFDAFGPAPGALSNGVVRSLVAAHAAATVQKIGYVGGRRYISLLADFSGTHGSGTPISALVIRGNGHIKP